jgi:hypothetical protein
MRGPPGPQARTVRTADRPGLGPDRPPAQNGAQQSCCSFIIRQAPLHQSHCSSQFHVTGKGVYLRKWTYIWRDIICVCISGLSFQDVYLRCQFVRFISYIDIQRWIQVMDTSNHKIGFKISARPKRKRHKPQKKGEYRRFWWGTRAPAGAGNRGQAI